MPIEIQEAILRFDREGSEEEAAQRFALLQEAGRLDLESGILELAGMLRKPHGPLPSRAVADTIHWAVASAYGYESPTLCSPEELERELRGVDA